MDREYLALNFLVLHKSYNFIKKRLQAQVFSCEYCKILKNTYLLVVLLFFMATNCT